MNRKAAFKTPVFVKHSSNVYSITTLIVCYKSRLWLFTGIEGIVSIFILRLPMPTVPEVCI